MEPRDYADVRRHALVRAAVRLGVAADEAPALVDRVIEDQRRRIRRAEDPDPLVHAALEEAVRRRATPPGQSDPPGATGAGAGLAGIGTTPGRSRSRLRSRWPVIAALAVALAAVVVAATALRAERPPAHHLRSDQVPSLFGYDAGSARRLLTDRGLEVTVEPIRSCEILGRAVGTDPPTGSTYHRGDPVTVFAAIPANVECLTDYADRSTAWRFLDFATGRAPAPTFTRRVRVYRDDAAVAVLHRGHAADRRSWDRTGVLQVLRDALGRVALTEGQPIRYAVPTLHVVPLDDRDEPCTGPLAPRVARLPGMSFVLQAPGTSACLLRVDLLRNDHDPGSPITAVVLRTDAA